jgi:hypothetical protein
MSHGLQLQGAYTWIRAFTTANFSNDPNNAASFYGLNAVSSSGSGGYRPQRFVFNYSWDLPLGNPEGLKGKLVHGWNLSGVTILQDGLPLTITDGRGGSIFGSPEPSRAEFCPGMGNGNVAASGGIYNEVLNGLSATSTGGYFNKSAFCVGGEPAIGNGLGYGNTGIGFILGPGQFNWDMSLVKTTVVGGLREDATLTFRTEFFNAFNHPQFSAPVVSDSATNFGQINSASVNPRLIQFALKYAF